MLEKIRKLATLNIDNQVLPVSSPQVALPKSVALQKILGPSAPALTRYSALHLQG
jgi:hypothetical protein